MTAPLGFFMNEAINPAIYPVFITLAITWTLVGLLMYFPYGRFPGKTMAVAQAAYRETVRQPLFWFLLIFFIVLMVISVFVPYFTFGEDLTMMIDLQLDAILLPALILSVFTAALTISEEIEGRTAITLLSKPVARWNFLLGKFFGIFLAVMFLTLILTLVMSGTVIGKIAYDDIDDKLPGHRDEVAAVKEFTATMPGGFGAVAENALMVHTTVKMLAPGPIMILGQIFIMTALAVALATRFPLVLNLTVCFGFFFIGRLTPALKKQAGENPLIKFIANVIGIILPDLSTYDVGQQIAQGLNTVAWSYIGQTWLQGVLYATICLLFGLILFEDRDLA